MTVKGKWRLPILNLQRDQKICAKTYMVALNILQKTNFIQLVHGDAWIKVSRFWPEYEYPDSYWSPKHLINVYKLNES